MHCVDWIKGVAVSNSADSEEDDDDDAAEFEGVATDLLIVLRVIKIPFQILCLCLHCVYLLFRYKRNKKGREKRV